MGRKRQEQITLDFTITFVEGTPEYDAACYFNNGPIPQQEAFIIAIAATYSMVGAAMRGADEQTVRDRIAFSDEAIHGYQMRALGRINGECSVFRPTENTTLEPESAQDEAYVNQDEMY